MVFGLLQITAEVTIYPSMQHTIEFVKASGAGNDFVLIDNSGGTLRADQQTLAVALCSRPFGIGADGLLVLEKSRRADFQMRYYNADGSYGGMCGNGGRCIAMFAFRRGLVSDAMRFDALDHIYSAQVTGEKVLLKMKPPVDFRSNIRLEAGGQSFVGQFVDTGSPHVVIKVDDLELIDVVGIGRAIRYHREFQPAGTNVNFLRIVEGGGAIQIRTYERGVENETHACGTGAVASAVVANLTEGIRQPVRVRVRSGEELLVHLESSTEKITGASLEGSAHMLFQGKVIYDDVSRKIFLPL
jgi:diaminopimelate epimerase